MILSFIRTKKLTMRLPLGLLSHLYSLLSFLNDNQKKKKATGTSQKKFFVNENKRM